VTFPRAFWGDAIRLSYSRRVSPDLWTMLSSRYHAFSNHSCCLLRTLATDDRPVERWIYGAAERCAAIRPTAFEVRFETPPGRRAQIDFLHFPHPVYRLANMERVDWLFSLVFGHSRMLWRACKILGEGHAASDRSSSSLEGRKPG
jgi:hypothetical protein